MSITHTPRSWRIVDRPSRGLNIEWGPDDGVERPICHMRWTDGLRHEVETRVREDATLIAAAPDLHDACVEAEDWLDNHGGDPDDDPGLAIVLSILRAAIAKAEGRS